MMLVTCPGPGGGVGGSSVKSPSRTRLRPRKGAKILPNTCIPKMIRLAMCKAMYPHTVSMVTFYPYIKAAMKPFMKHPELFTKSCL